MNAVKIKSLVILTFGLLSSNLLYAQSCGSGSSGNSGFFSSITFNNKGSNYKKIKTEPIIRTEEGELYWGLNLLIPKYNRATISPGANFGILGKTKTKNLYVGGYFNYNFMYTFAVDAEHGEHDRIKTNSSIYGIGAIAKYRFFNSQSLDAYIKSSLGMAIYKVNTWLKDEDYECADKELRQELNSDSSLSRVLSFAVGIQVPLKSFYDKFFIELNYLLPSRVSYIGEEEITIYNAEVTYSPVATMLQYFSPQIGFSHYF